MLEYYKTFALFSGKNPPDLPFTVQWESFSFTLLRSTVCTSRFWFPLKDSIPQSFEIYAQGQGPLKDDQVRFQSFIPLFTLSRSRGTLVSCGHNLPVFLFFFNWIIHFVHVKIYILIFKWSSSFQSWYIFYSIFFSINRIHNVTCRPRTDVTE